MVLPVFAQKIQLFFANNRIHDEARHDDEDDLLGIFLFGHGGDF